MAIEIAESEKSRVHQVVANKLDSADYDEREMLPAFQRVRSDELSESIADIVRGVIDWYRNYMLDFPPILNPEHHRLIREAEEFYEDFFYSIVYGAKKLGAM